MAMRALTDGLGHAFYSGGRMVVVLDPPLQIAASLAGAGRLFVETTIVPRGRVPTSQPPKGNYVPLNAFIRRTIVRKRR